MPNERPGSSDVIPHSGEVTFDLRQALYKINRLMDFATSRGDQRGHSELARVRDGVTALIEDAAKAFAAQDLRAKRTDPCPTCKR